MTLIIVIDLNNIANGLEINYCVSLKRLHPYLHGANDIRMKTEEKVQMKYMNPLVYNNVIILNFTLYS